MFGEFVFVDVSSIWLLLWQGYKIRDVGASERNSFTSLDFVVVWLM